MKIYITGTGVISALGLSCEENLDKLIRQQTGIKKFLFRDSNDKFLGRVPIINSHLTEQLNFSGQTSRTALLALKASMEAWGESKQDDSLRTAVISGNSVGGMDYTEQYVLEQVKDGQTDKVERLSSHPCGYSTSVIADRIGGVKYANTISTACSSGANSILQAVKLMNAGKIDRAIAGGTDSLSLFTIQGFSSLMIFDSELCKPFDANRKGLNLGEGAGYLLLETEKSLEKTGSTVLAELSGYGIANDSYHQTALSPEGKGAVMAMEQSLERAELTPIDIDYLNMHGTSTENNDEVELGASIKVFNGNLPPYSSTKSFTGHTLGASGAIEAVYAVMAIQHQKVFASLNIKNDLNPKLPAQKTTIDAKVNHVLSNSFGFGGNQTSLIISKHG